MKKYFLLVLLVFSFLLPNNVFADEFNHQTMELIPISEEASIDTVYYSYHHISYINEVDRQSYGVFKISMVNNKTHVTKPIAIDILLFDANRVNIGFIAYCTTKDLAGEYAQIELEPKSGSPLTIFVDTYYFDSNHIKNDIAYYAVLDDNQKCYVGNGNKYSGLTIEQIKNGEVSPTWNDNGFINSFSFILNVGIYTFIGILLFLMALYVMYAMLLEYLSKKMFAKKSKYKFIPIINMVISLNIAFGRIIAIIGVLGFAGAIYLGIKGNWILLYVVIGISVFSVIINIIKFFTKKYDLLFFDPFIKNDGSNPNYLWKKVRVTGNKKAHQILNLDYSEKDLQKHDITPNKDTAAVEFTPISMDEIESKEQMIKKLLEAPPEPEGPVFTPVQVEETNTAPTLEKLDDGSKTILTVPSATTIVEPPEPEEAVPVPIDNAALSAAVSNETADVPVVPTDTPVEPVSTEASTDNEEDSLAAAKKSQEEFMDMFR